MAYDKTTFLSGLAMGLTGKGNPTFEASDVFGKGYITGAKLRDKRRMPEGEPVAYLYNGVELPALPEWEIEGFPYITLKNDGESDYPRYGLVVIYSTIPLLHTSYESGVVTIRGCILAPSPTVVRDSYWSVGDWVDITERNCDDLFGEHDGFYRVRLANSVVWANYDVYDTEGNLLVSPSEPIPVYE